MRWWCTASLPSPGGKDGIQESKKPVRHEQKNNGTKEWMCTISLDFGSLTKRELLGEQGHPAGSRGGGSQWCEIIRSSTEGWGGKEQQNKRTRGHRPVM